MRQDANFLSVAIAFQVEIHPFPEILFSTCTEDEASDLVEGCGQIYHSLCYISLHVPHLHLWEVFSSYTLVHSKMWTCLGNDH